MKEKSESEVTQLCSTPSDPMDFSLPGSSIHGIFQAGIAFLWNWNENTFSSPVATAEFSKFAGILSEWEQEISVEEGSWSEMFLGKCQRYVWMMDYNEKDLIGKKLIQQVYQFTLSFY